MALEALRTRQLTSIRDYCHRAGANAPLVCIPIAGADENVWGLVFIYEFPFMSMNEQHIQLLAVLGAHIGDYLTCRDSTLSRRSPQREMVSNRHPLRSRSHANGSGSVIDTGSFDSLIDMDTDVVPANMSSAASGRSSSRMDAVSL